MAYMKDYKGRRLDAFDPNKDVSLISSYDASKLIGANGSNISVWPDSGPTFQDLTNGTVATQPTLITNGLNGKSVVRLGATSFVSKTDFGAGFENGGAGYSQPLSIAAVYKISSTASRVNPSAITGWVSPAASNRISVQLDVDGCIALYGGANVGSVGGKPVNDDQWHITIAQFDTSSSSFYTDGYLVSAVNSQVHGSNVLRGFGIGAAADGTTPLGQSDIAQVDVIQGRLTRFQVDQYTQYMSVKWGLS